MPQPLLAFSLVNWPDFPESHLCMIWTTFQHQFLQLHEILKCLQEYNFTSQPIYIKSAFILSKVTILISEADWENMIGEERQVLASIASWILGRRQNLQVEGYVHVITNVASLWNHVIAVTGIVNTPIFRMPLLCHFPPLATADWIRDEHLTQLNQSSSPSWESGIETVKRIEQWHLNFFESTSLSVKRFNYTIHRYVFIYKLDS